MNLFVPAWLVGLVVVLAPFAVMWAVNAADNTGGYFQGFAGGLAFIVTAAALWPATLVWYFLR